MTASVLIANGARTRGRRGEVYWQTRLDEVKRADREELRTYVPHHLARAIDEEVDTIPDAYSQYDRWIPRRETVHPDDWETESRERARMLFRSFMIMGRVEPGIEALRRLAGGELPAEIEDELAHVWTLLERVERVRQLYESVSSEDRWQLPWTSFLEPLRLELRKALLNLERMANYEFELGSIYIGRRLQRDYAQLHRSDGRPR